MMTRSVLLKLGDVMKHASGRVGAPKNELHESFFRGAYLHYTANRLGPPTFTDLADLALYWGFENDERKKVCERWRKRIREPWAKEAASLISEWIGH